MTKILWLTKETILGKAEDSLKQHIGRKKETVQFYWEDFIAKLPEQVDLSKSREDFFQDIETKLEDLKQSSENAFEEYSEAKGSEVSHYFNSDIRAIVEETVDSLSPYVGVNKAVFKAGVAKMWEDAESSARNGDEKPGAALSGVLDMIYQSEPEELSEINGNEKGVVAFQELSAYMLHADENDTKVSTSTLENAEFPSGSNLYSVLYNLLKDKCWSFDRIKSLATKYAGERSNRSEIKPIVRFLQSIEHTSASVEEAREEVERYNAVDYTSEVPELLPDDAPDAAIDFAINVYQLSIVTTGHANSTVMGGLVTIPKKEITDYLLDNEVIKRSEDGMVYVPAQELG